MQPVPKILGRVEETVNRSREIIEHEREWARQEILRTRAELLSGQGSTGSELHDNLIMMFGESPDVLLQQETVKNYEQVSKAIKGKTGKPVMIVSRRLEDSFKIVGPSDNFADQYVVEDFSLGVLAMDKLEFDISAGTVYLPTSRYVESTSQISQAQVVEDKIKVDNKLMSWMNEYSIKDQLGLNINDLRNSQDLRSNLPFQAMLEIIAGRADIAGWLNLNGQDARQINQLLPLIGLKPITIT